MTTWCSFKAASMSARLPLTGSDSGKVMAGAGTGCSGGGFTQNAHYPATAGEVGAGTTLWAGAASVSRPGTDIPGSPPPASQPLKSSALQRLADLALSTDAQRRRPLALILLGCAHYGINAALAWWSIGAGYTQAGLGGLLIACMVTGPLVFYGLVRSGISQRFEDPSLVMAQSLFCVMAIVLGFVAVNMQLRGLVLAVLPLVFMFGQFTLAPRQITGISTSAIGALAAVTVGWWALDVAGHDFIADFFQWIFISAIVMTTARVAQTVSRLRFHLEVSQGKLATALAKMGEMATRDELTGLVNRRRMLELLHDELARERRLDQPLCIALLDIDHFKRFNDQHGHQLGDEVLRHFAATGQAALRETDTLARWGGEEFLLLCPGGTGEQASIGLDRFREQLATAPLATAGRVTFSAGVAWHRPGEAIEETIARADQALYQAKADGRDRTVQNP
ncbi:MAG: GGDEF domain-containing protein [Rubrivivax sp.]|nr:MAG: GGDEF domain-containing protein [Rubrivivax sp.]